MVMVQVLSGSKDVSSEGLPIRILTHNIRYAPISRLPNEKPWKNRLPLILSQFSYHTRFHSGSGQQHPSGASFICLQEVLHSQLQDILQALNDKNPNSNQNSKLLPSGPDWSYIGVARDDGKTKGEYNPILYPTHLFDLLHFETTWLSHTPDRPSRGWDAGCVRILTTGVFQHTRTRQRLAVFNTHLDHAGSVAREKGVGVILAVIERVRRDWSGSAEDGLSYCLAGDFNSFPSQEAYKALVASDTMLDSHEIVEKSARYGSEVTFTGFRPGTGADKDSIGRIDYVWFGPKERREGEQLAGWKVQGYATLPNVFDDGVFCSDHRCVVADAVLTTGKDDHGSRS